MAVADHQQTYVLSPGSESCLHIGQPWFQQHAEDIYANIGTSGMTQLIEQELAHFNIASVIRDGGVKVEVGDFGFTLDPGDEAVNADNCWVRRLLVDYLHAEATGEIRKTGTSWNTDGARGAESDYTATNQKTFAMPTTSGAKTIDISAIVQDALDADLDDLWLLFMEQSDAAPSNAFFWLISTTLLTLTVTPLLYFEWLEANELVPLPNDTTAKVVLQMGTRAFAANDRVRVAYSTDPTMATGVLYTTKVDVSAKDDGDWVNLPISSLVANTRYYYRIQASTDDGANWDIWGDIRTFPTQPAATSDVMITLSADAHWATKWNQRNDNAHFQASVDIDQLVSDNIAAETDGDGEPSSLHLDAGDGILYGQGDTMFPLDADGSGDSTSPTASLVTNQSDCNEMIRAARRWRRFPFYSLPYFEGPSNHKPSHHFHYVANVPANTFDAAARTNLAMQNGLGHPAAAGGIYRGQATYGAFDWGPLLVCFVDPLLDSEHPSPTPPPTSYPSNQDFVLSTAQRDFFLHATTGELAITTKPWVIFVCHHLLGGNEIGTAYGRGGLNHVKEADTYWADTVHPALQSLKQANSNIKGVIVILGHDHCHQFGSLDGINYCHLATPSNEVFPLGSYDDGFASAGYGNYLGNFSPNAGHYRIDASPTSFAMAFKRGYLAATGESDPSDGIILNGQEVDRFVLPVSGGIASPPASWVHRKTRQGQRRQ